MSVTGAASSRPKRRRSSTEQVVPGNEVPTGNGHFLHPRASRDAFGSGRSLSPFDDPNYPIPNFEKVYEKMRHPTAGLSVADRRWRLISYSKCFVGTEAVQWMTENLSVDKEKAISLGQRLMDAGIIHHVTQSEPFSDAYYFFRFQEDVESNVLNMKRVWDPKIPTRSAVTVSQDLLTQLAILCEQFRVRFSEAKNIAVSHTAVRTPEAGKTERSERTSEDIKQSSEDYIDPSSLPQSKVQNHSIANGILSSPLLGSIPRNIINTLAPYAPGGGSPNLKTIQESIKGNSGSGDDVDYSLLAKSEAFRKYTLAAAELQHVQLVGLTHDESLAVFVNVYNTLCLHGYVVNGPPSNVFRRWVFFRSICYRIAGLDMTLDDIEHGILRGNKRPPTLVLMLMQQLRPSDPKCQYVINSRDARIHFVISAGTRSDPPVRILNGENLQEELHEATLEFLGCSVKVEKERNVVTLPRIFLWYPDDFPTPENALLKWVAKYLPVQRSDQLRDLLAEPDSKPTVVYESFDWNSAEARFEASVIRRKRRKLARECAPQGATSQSVFPILPLFSFPNFPAPSPEGDHTLTTPLLASHPLLLRRHSLDDGDAQSVSVNRPLTSDSRLSDIQFPMPPMPAFLQNANSEVPISDPVSGSIAGRSSEATSPPLKEK